MVVKTPAIHAAPQPCTECVPSGNDWRTFPAGQYVVGLVEWSGQIVALARCPKGHSHVVVDPDIKEFPDLLELVDDLNYLEAAMEAERRAGLKAQHTQNRISSAASVNPHPRYPSRQ